MLSILIRSVQYFTRFLYIIIFANAILSWFPRARASTIGKFIYNLSEPMLSPIRKVISKFSGTLMIDFSPLIAYFLIGFLENLILHLLIRLL